MPRVLRRLLVAPLLPAAILVLFGVRVGFRVMYRLGNPAGLREIEAAAERALGRGETWSAAFFARWLVAEEPSAPAGYYLLHRAYLRRGQRAEAATALAAGLRVAPSDWRLQLALAAFTERGQALPDASALPGRGLFQLPGLTRAPEPPRSRSVRVRAGARPRRSGG